MSTGLTGPAALLESLGGFSESRYLSLFSALDREELATVLRGLNATEIAIEGKSFLVLDAILQPLDTGMFPRRALHQIAENTTCISDVMGDTSPLTLAYCASLLLYTIRAAEEPTWIAAGENGFLALNTARLKLGSPWDTEMLKFCLWCLTRRHPEKIDGDHSWPSCLYLAFCFLLFSDLFVSMAGVLIKQVAVDTGGDSIAEASVDDRYIGMLRRDCEARLGEAGTVPTAISRAKAAMLAKRPGDIFSPNQ